MGNIKNFNFNKLDLRLSNSDYWDFYLGIDENYQTDFECIISGDCVVSQFDFFDSNIFNSPSDIKTIYSLKSWVDAVNTGVTATTYGLTGIDNGVLDFVKFSSDTSNELLVDVLTGSTLNITSGDTRFFMNRVSGSTENVVYPLELIEDNSVLGNYMNFKGGFYQGYYKLDGYNYEVLPNRVNKGMMFEFWLNKNDSIITTDDVILNDLYPENKGIFFYWGTRAENKFWNQFEGNNTGSTSGCTIGSTELCTIPKEKDILIVNEKGFALPLNPPQIIYTDIENEFLLYGRARSNRCLTDDEDLFRLGTLKACQVTGDTPTFTITSTTQTQTNFTNPFLIYGRSRGHIGGRPSDGYGRETACSFSGITTELLELDKDADIIDNALAFIIKDDGSIGYRLLTVTASCVNDKTITGATIQEEFSLSGMVSNEQWEHVAVRWVTNYYDDCDVKEGKARTGRLMFYVNCRLKFVAENFPEFIAKRLNEYKEKQIGVPFNISLGGGSQGLLESMTFDGQDADDLNLLIERNFAGSFIGSISQFKIYNCDVNWCVLKTLCNNPRYIPEEECFIVDELGQIIIQEDGFSITFDCNNGECYLIDSNGNFIVDEENNKIIVSCL